MKERAIVFFKELFSAFAKGIWFVVQVVVSLYCAFYFGWTWETFLYIALGLLVLVFIVKVLLPTKWLEEPENKRGNDL